MENHLQSIPVLPKQKWNFFTDPSSWLIIITNLLVIFVALQQNWDVKSLLFLYWIDVVFIGVFTVLKILRLKQIEGEKVRLITKIIVAVFFVISFSIGLWFYTLLLAGTKNVIPNISQIVSLSLVLFFQHLFIFISDVREERFPQSYRQLFLEPFAYFFPMILFFIFAAGSECLFTNKNLLVLFLLIKTAVDIKIHMIDHETYVPQSTSPEETSAIYVKKSLRSLTYEVLEAIGVLLIISSLIVIVMWGPFYCAVNS